MGYIFTVASAAINCIQGILYSLRFPRQLFLRRDCLGATGAKKKVGILCLIKIDPHQLLYTCRLQEASLFKTIKKYTERQKGVCLLAPRSNAATTMKSPPVSWWEQHNAFSTRENRENPTRYPGEPKYVPVTARVSSFSLTTGLRKSHLLNDTLVVVFPLPISLPGSRDCCAFYSRVVSCPALLAALTNRPIQRTRLNGYLWKDGPALPPPDRMEKSSLCSN